MLVLLILILLLLLLLSSFIQLGLLKSSAMKQGLRDLKFQIFPYFFNRIAWVFKKYLGEPYEDFLCPRDECQGALCFTLVCLSVCLSVALKKFV